MGPHSQVSRSQVSSSRTAALIPTAVKPSEFHGIVTSCAAGSEFDLDHFLISGGEAIVSKFRKSECIFAQGDPEDFVIYVRAGTAKIMVVSNKGKEATVGVIRPGDFCGENCLIEEEVRLQTAMTMTPCAVLRIPKRSFSRLLKEHSDFSST